MERLNALDASFLELETSDQPTHVASLAVYGPPCGAAAADPGAILDALRERVLAFPALRRRLVEAPFGIDRPSWIDDPAIDLDYHLRRAALPAPGDDAELATLVTRLHARALDRTRPLWEVTVIEGLEGGRVAVYTKLHHAAVDGVTGIALLAALSDEHGAAREALAASTPARPRPLPGTLSRLARGVAGRAGRPRERARLALQTASALVATRAVASLATASGLLPFAHAAGAGRVPGLYRWLGLTPTKPGAVAPIPATPAPRTPWNRAISAHRRFAGASLPLASVKRVREVYGATLNDVVMAVTSHALRRYLDARGALPAEPLLAMVPISLHGRPGASAGGNQVTMALADLATDEADPARRLRRIAGAMEAAKAMHAETPAGVLQALAPIGTSLIGGGAMQALVATGLLDRMTPPFNVTISNVPGPRTKVSLGGAPMQAVFPVSIVAHGQGLNVTLVSYLDRIHVGLVACRELVPDLDELARGFAEGLEILLKRADAHAATVR